MSASEGFTRLFLANPLLRREIALLRRARWQRVTMRVTWGLFALMLVVGGLGGVSDSYFIRSTTNLSMFLLGAVVLLRATVGGAAAIAHEQAQRTWEMLVLTRLQPIEILVAKVAPVLLVALLPALVGLPYTLMLAWGSDMPVASVFLCLVGILALSLPVAALAVRVSAAGQRTTDVVVRIGLVLLLVSPLLIDVFGAILRGARADGLPEGEWLLAGVLVLLAVSVAAAVLLGTAEALPGVLASYTRQVRLIGGGAYILLLFLVYLRADAGVDHLRGYAYSPEIVAGAHMLLAALGAAVCCAGSPAPPTRRAGRANALSAFAEGYGGMLRLWLLLYAAGAVAGLWFCMEPAWPDVWVRTQDGILGPAWAIALGLSGLLASGGFGCALSRMLPRARPAARVALATLVPLGLFVLPQLLAGSLDDLEGFSGYGVYVAHVGPYYVPAGGSGYTLAWTLETLAQVPEQVVALLWMLVAGVTRCHARPVVMIAVSLSVAALSLGYAFAPVPRPGRAPRARS